MNGMDHESRFQLADRLRLYVVTDERSNSDSLIATVNAAIHGGATAIQLRRKDQLGRAFMTLGHALRRLTLDAGVLFFVNDRVDVAVVVDADGVHVGQDDISCRDARRLLPGKLIGVSAATPEEAAQAEQDGADYLGVGAVYTTQSKLDADYTGIEGLRTIAHQVSIPVVAIGGIHMGNIDPVFHAGAAGAAVVSAVMSAENPEAATRTLLSRVPVCRAFHD